MDLSDSIFVKKFVVPVCWVCARRTRADSLPDVCSGMEDWEIRAELGIEDEGLELPDSFTCHWCGASTDVEEGFWVDTVDAVEAFSLSKPPAAVSRRPSRSLRDFVRRRDLCECAICGKPLTWDQCTIDHVQAWSKGGATEADNLVVTCLACNQLKGDREFTVRTVIRPDLLFPESELANVSPDEVDEAADRLTIMMQCLCDGVPLDEQHGEVTRRMRLVRRGRRTT